MSLTVVVDESVLDRAIARASGGGGTRSLAGLNAPLDTIVAGRVSEVWNAMTTALRKGFELGEERARQYLDAAIDRCREVLAEAGDTAAEVARELRDRLRELIRSYIEEALGVMESSVRIGGRELVVSSIAVEQKVILTGDLTLSMAAAFKLASSGEIKVAASYTLADQTK
jgi:hypothetical protein